MSIKTHVDLHPLNPVQVWSFKDTLPAAKHALSLPPHLVGDLLLPGASPPAAAGRPSLQQHPAALPPPAGLVRHAAVGAAAAAATLEHGAEAAKPVRHVHMLAVLHTQGATVAFVLQAALLALRFIECIQVTLKHVVLFCFSIYANSSVLGIPEP